jgi:hypothetical protein
MAEARNPIERKYHVVPPRSYSAVPLPGKAVQEAAAAVQRIERVAEAAPEAEAPKKKRAVWIVHGMGQQVPFETTDRLAEGLMRVSHPVPGRDGFEPRVRTVQIGDQTVQRVELDVFQGGGCIELHLYEAYWAPVTEGKVKLSEVISFLFSASFRGLLNAVQPFHRAMFDQFVKMRISWRTALEIALALLTLVSLVAINAVILAAGASHYGLTGQKLPHAAENWVALSAIASWLSAVALAFGLILLLAEHSQPADARSFMRWVITRVGWAAFALTLVAIIGGGIALAGFAVFSSSELSSWDPFFAQLQALAAALVLVMAALTICVLALRGVLRSAGRQVWSALPYLPGFLVSTVLFAIACAGPILINRGWMWWPTVYSHLPAWLSRRFWVWPLLLLVSWLVRELMVQYVGDVAAYVTSQTLDRFNKIRQRIKQIAMDSARAVYLAQEDGEFLYDKIAVVGHSLGSVIAYDTLNALLNAEKLSITDLEIASRTCLLETFGSPLDKVAFFFSFQGADMMHIREQLATAVQPLISSYEEFRKVRWINVYSPNDIVSGKVELYDLPPEGQPEPIRELIRQRGVQRFTDPDAIVPLVAHVDYWKNKEVWRRLLAEVTR